MVTFNRRGFLRRYLKTPIEFSALGLAHDQRGLMFDCCKGGMHFISDHYVEPGATIFLSPCEALRTYFPATDGCGCRATVIWCRRGTEGEAQGFKIGVQFEVPDDRRGFAAASAQSQPDTQRPTFIPRVRLPKNSGSTY